MWGNMVVSDDKEEKKVNWETERRGRMPKSATKTVSSYTNSEEARKGCLTKRMKNGVRIQKKIGKRGGGVLV